MLKDGIDLLIAGHWNRTFLFGCNSFKQRGNQEAFSPSRLTWKSQIDGSLLIEEIVAWIVPDRVVHQMAQAGHPEHRRSQSNGMLPGATCRYAASTRLSNRGNPSVPPNRGSTRSSGWGIRPNTRWFAEKIPAMERALPLRFASGVVRPWAST